MIKESTHIYVLICPETGQVRYVGKSNDIKRRYSQHCNRNDKNKKTSWVKSLLNKGLKPIIEIIDEVPYCDWKFWEEHYIKLYKSAGARLTNLAVGGQGGEPNKESIEKYKQTMKGRVYEYTPARKKSVENLIALNIEPWNKGKRYTVNLTDEQRKNRSKIQKGRHGGKPVAQYRLDGNFVRLWDTAYSIEKESNLGITFKEVSLCCLNKITHSKGFMWHFATESTPIKIKPCSGIIKSKPVKQIDFNGDVVKIWNSCAEIVKELGYDMRNISACALGKKKSFKGYKWLY